MLVTGEYIENIKCESFFDKKENRIRIRVLKGQGLPNDIVVESSKVFRNTKDYPLGTKFNIKKAKVCTKVKEGKESRQYLSAKGQHLYELEK